MIDDRRKLSKNIILATETPYCEELLCNVFGTKKWNARRKLWTLCFSYDVGLSSKLNFPPTVVLSSPPSFSSASASKFPGKMGQTIFLCHRVFHRRQISVIWLWVFRLWRFPCKRFPPALLDTPGHLVLTPPFAKNGLKIGWKARKQFLTSFPRPLVHRLIQITIVGPRNCPRCKILSSSYQTTKPFLSDPRFLNFKFGNSAGSLTCESDWMREVLARVLLLTWCVRVHLN